VGSGAQRYCGAGLPPNPRGGPGLIRVVIAADIRLYREGLAERLDREAGIKVVGTAADWPQSLTRLRDLMPDVVLVDMVMPESVLAVRSICAAAPAVKVVALAVPETERDVFAYSEAGIAGYITREASIEELVQTIESTARGELILSPRMAATLLRHVATLATEGGAEMPEARLTTRELEIVELMDEGLSNKEIARRLSIGLPTVKNHVHHILEKLQVTRRSEAGARVRSRGLMSRSRRSVGS
jgi:two-component system, NarL family, nitrate/nitrite response regulator NarL